MFISYNVLYPIGLSRVFFYARIITDNIWFEFLSILFKFFQNVINVKISFINVINILQNLSSIKTSNIADLGSMIIVYIAII